MKMSPCRLPLRINFERQHSLGGIEALLRGLVVESLPRARVELLRDPLAVVLRHVSHARPLR